MGMGWRMYSHRNGESDPPALTDHYYWFSHADVNTTGVLQDLVYVFSAEEDMPSYIYFEDSLFAEITNNGRIALVDLRGQWWGPIIPPWEQL